MNLPIDKWDDLVAELEDIARNRTARHLREAGEELAKLDLVIQARDAEIEVLKARIAELQDML